MSTTATLASSSTNGNAARWNLVISEQTNIAVRSFLALKGFKKGDLSSFVEEAVRWRVFDQTLAEARSGFDDLQVDEAQNMLEEALAEVRAEGLSAGRYAAFSSTKASQAKKA
jgi:Ribbon-helix-helix domain